jgi:HAD superfamily phosphatase (TIGR01668 family)
MPLSLVPRAFFSRVEEITPIVLHALGARAVILDLDNTLAPRGSHSVSSSIRTWLLQLKQDGFPLFLLSNSPLKRVIFFAQTLGIEPVRGGPKPLPSGYRWVFRKLGIPPQQVAVIGDQIFTDILGGNWSGACTILVRPLEPQTDFFTTKLLRKLERGLLRGEHNLHK